MLSSTSLMALKYCGAKRGVREGFNGRAYAVPTMNNHRRALPISKILENIDRLIENARRHPTRSFLVPRLGCGSNGRPEYEEDISKKFLDARLPNLWLPGIWLRQRQKRLARIAIIVPSVIDHEALFERIDSTIKNVVGEYFHIVVPGDPRVSGAAFRYAKSRDFSYCLINPYAYKARRDEGLIKELAFWYSTHAIILYGDDLGPNKQNPLLKVADHAIRRRLATRCFPANDKQGGL
jgi:hypothetical protein